MLGVGTSSERHHKRVTCCAPPNQQLNEIDHVLRLSSRVSMTESLKVLTVDLNSLERYSTVTENSIWFSLFVGCRNDGGPRNSVCPRDAYAAAGYYAG